MPSAGRAWVIGEILRLSKRIAGCRLTIICFSWPRVIWPPSSGRNSARISSKHFATRHAEDVVTGPGLSGPVTESGLLGSASPSGTRIYLPFASAWTKQLLLAMGCQPEGNCWGPLTVEKMRVVPKWAPGDWQSAKQQTRLFLLSWGKQSRTDPVVSKAGHLRP